MAMGARREDSGLPPLDSYLTAHPPGRRWIRHNGSSPFCSAPVSSAGAKSWRVGTGFRRRRIAKRRQPGDLKTRRPRAGHWCAEEDCSVQHGCLPGEPGPICGVASSGLGWRACPGLREARGRVSPGPRRRAAVPPNSPVWADSALSTNAAVPTPPDHPCRLRCPPR